MTPSSSASDFGGTLRQAREGRGVSLRQIATSTKISVGVLEALERNDFSKLPGGIFSRAFVRSYALEVGLDPEEIVREFLANLPSDSPVAGPYTPARQVDQEESAFESQQRMAGVALKLILVSLPIAVLLLYLTLGRSGRSPAPAVPTPARPSTAAPSPASSESIRMEPQVQPTTAPVAGVPGVTEATREAAPAATGAGEPAARAGDDLALEVAPVAPCWVSLTVDDQVVVARIVDPGERIVRRIRRDAVLHVGDAGAFAFAINGRPGRPLGAPGEVKSLRITRDNYDTFLR